MSYAESWGGFLSKEVQFRCKICTDGVGGHADIACADAWYGDDAGYPKFDEQDGRSLVMSRTSFGASFLEDATRAGAIELSPLAAAEIGRMQPSQARRKRLLLARTAALHVIGRPVPRYTGTMVLQAARLAGIGESLRGFFGMLRRALFMKRAAF
jgi:coenzyme F420 hydrogenase subunit beta